VILDIDGQDVRLDFVHNLGKFPQGYSLGGLYEPEKRRIQIVTTMPRSGQRATVIHELAHHAVDRSGGRRALGFTKVQEEAFCDAVDSWIAIAIHDNPELAAFLTS